jgi:hypothetical protein
MLTGFLRRVGAGTGGVVIIEENLVRVVDGRAGMAGNRVPHRLEDSMQRRISHTTPAGERVVTVAASLARQFTLSQIATMARLPIADLVDPVREVIDAGIFTETGGCYDGGGAPAGCARPAPVPLWPGLTRR